MKTREIILACWMFLLSTNFLSTQPIDTYVIPKLTGEITLDGKVDESAWEEVKPLPLVTHWPTFGQKVEKEKTQIRIAHDGEYLYVSCRCYVDPERIHAPTYKRDEMNLSVTNVSIILDNFNDNENALWFAVTPTGSRTDAAFSNDGEQTNFFWNTIWEAESEITDFGWTTEMRIPFSSLRFKSKDGRVEMGLIAFRYMAHNTSLHLFPAIPPNWGFQSWSKVSQAQKIVIENVESQTPVFITPYLLGGAQRISSVDPTTENYEHDTRMTYDAGLDLKIGLTDNTTLDLTVNTDFAQVEADNQQINLSRFSLFFPERRQFFLERATIFDFSFGGSDRLFHSRRIGLHQGQPVRIWGGARVITRTGDWDIGFLSMQTARDEGLLSKNNSILRVRKRVLNPRSYIGGMITGRIDEKGNYNLNYGLDGILNLWGDDFLNINMAQTSDNHLETSAFDFESMRLQAEWERRIFQGLNYKLNLNYSGKAYEPSLGFQLRNNFTRLGDRISWGWLSADDSPLHRIQISMNGAVYWDNESGKTETSKFGPSISIAWKSGDLAAAEFLYVTENITEGFLLAENTMVPAGLYRFPEAQLSYHTPRGEPLRAILRARGGGFFDGNRISGSIEPNWDPSRVVNLSLFYQLNRVAFPDRNQELLIHIARFRTEFTFNTRFTLSSFIQYNSAMQIGILNFRFRYNPRDGNNFYLVFNDILNIDRKEVNPNLPFSENRAVMVKLDHTF